MNRLKKITVILMAAMTAFAVAPVTGISFTSQVQASTNGKSADDAINWVKSQEGKSLDYDNAYGAQCVDLIAYYYSFLGQDAYVGGNAYEYSGSTGRNNCPPGWSRIQGAPPQKGDILVYTGGNGGNGHVAIYESDYSTWHQNYSNQKKVVHVTNVKYNGLTTPYWGVVRPDFTGGSSSSDSSATDLDDNTGTQNIQKDSEGNFIGQINTDMYVTSYMKDANNTETLVFTAPGNGYGSVEVEGISGSWNKAFYLKVTDESKNNVYYNEYGLGIAVHNIGDFAVTQGSKYYVIINNYATYKGGKKYRVRFNYTEADDWETEDNNDIDSADTILADKTYYGSRAYSKDVDYFKLDLDKDSKVTLDFGGKTTGSKGRWGIWLYNDKGVELKELGNDINSNEEYTEYLDKGTYYLEIGGYKNTYGVEYKLSYSTEPHNHVYVRSSTVDSTTTSAGTVTYTCEECGNSYTDNMPTIVSNIKIKKAGKNKAKITWDKSVYAKGYKVSIKVGGKKYQNSTTKTSISVKAKKGQKITVSIRSYGEDKNTLAAAAKQSKKI